MFKNIKLINTILLFAIIVYCNSINAQTRDYDGTIYTPEGKAVTGVTITYSKSPQVMVSLTNEGDSLNKRFNLDAILLSSGTYEYNCAGYAFYMAEGYSYLYDIDMDASPFWSDNSFSNDNLSSYVLCPESEATHILYYRRGHIVRKIKNSYPTAMLEGRDCVSKWGNYGLYLHRKGYDPYCFGPSYPERLTDPNNFIYLKLKTTHSGILDKGNKTWIGAGGITHTLSGNVSVPEKISLNIKSGVTIDFSNNNYYILSTGGTITLESGVKFQGVYLYENGMIKGLFPTLESALNNATINQTVQTQSLVYYIQRTTTVPASVNLTISSGTVLNFNNNSSLTVNGNLNANGATFDFVTKSSGINYGINVYGTATLSSSTVKNASRGIYVVTPARLTLNNSTITNCGYGVYNDRAFMGVYNSTFTGCDAGIYSSNTNTTNTIPKIEHNTFYSNSCGIYLTASSPRINTNEFGKGVYGIYCSSNSSPLFGNEDESGNCSFYDNTYAMSVKYSSNPVLGSVGCINTGGYNTFLRSISYHILADNTCFVEAKCNYWNGLKISGAYVSYDPYFLVDATGYPLGSMAINTMSQSPEEKLYNEELASSNSLSVNMDINNAENNSQVKAEPQYNPKWPLKTKASFLRNLVLLKKYDNAMKIGKELLKDYPDSTLSVYALDLLWQAGRTTGERFKDFDSFLKDLTSKNEKKYLHGKSELILALCDSVNRIEALDKVMERYKGDNVLKEEILMDKFSCLLSRQEDRDKAASVLSEIDALFPNSQVSGIAHLLFDGKADNFNGSLLGKASTEGKDLAEETNSFETVKEYALLGNYPNPFNPETVIRYALPEESNVELRIYNLMGKLVRTFVYNQQSSGYKNITWNGKDESGAMVSSGIYIYRLQAVSNKNQGHVFIKSAKMMMLK